MNHSLDLSRQIAADRRITLTERHPKVAWNRRQRRTFSSVARHAVSTSPGRGR